MKKKFQKILIPVCGLFSVFTLGLFFGLNSWNKNLYVQWNPPQGRGIAGANSSPEILNLSSDQLTQQAGFALFSQNQVLEKEKLMAFYLGNVLIPDANSGKHRFICQVFPLVEFSFSAIGLHSSGEEGLMFIQSPCNTKNEDLIGPFWIPHKEILAKPYENSFEIPEKKTFIRFYNASIVLTDSWLLKSVKFFSEGERDSRLLASEPESFYRDNEFLVRFTPGEENPFFELSLKNTVHSEQTDSI